MAFQINDQVAITGRLMFGLPLAGDAELHVPGPDFDADIDGGFIFEIGGAVEYRLNDTVALVGGLAYESASYDWEWDGNNDGEDELDRFVITLGASFSF
jgi:hypothetical protein